MSQNTVQGKTRTCGARRTWTTNEEHCLMHAWKELISLGWKADNVFKTDFLTALEQAILKQFPSCDLKEEPHIHSKVHVWKKQYGSLSTMLTRSGFGWNNTSYTIDVPDDNVWNHFVKACCSLNV